MNQAVLDVLGASLGERSLDRLRAALSAAGPIEEGTERAIRDALATWPRDARTLALQADDSELHSVLHGLLGSLLRGVVVFETDAGAVLDALAASPAAASVESLEIGEASATVESVRALHSLAGLASLRLGIDAWSEARAASLRGAALPRLRSLGLDRRATTLLSALAGATFWPALEHLELDPAELSTSVVARMFDGPEAPRLTQLALTGVAPAALLASRAARDLRVLRGLLLDVPSAERVQSLEALTELDFVVRDPDALGVLARTPRPAVRTLTMSGPVGDEGLLFLARAFPNLVALRAHQCGITTPGAGHIGRTWRSLETLVLSFNAIGSDGARAIAPAVTLVNHLNLRNCGLDASGLDALLPALAGVTTLELGYNALADEGVAALARANLPHLERLGLAGTQLTLRGARALADSRNLAGLAWLDIDWHHADRALVPAGLAALIASPHLPAKLAGDLRRQMPKGEAHAPRKGIFARLLGWR